MECVKCKYELLFFDAHVDWDTAYDGLYEYNRGYGGVYVTFTKDLSNGAVVETVDKHDKTAWGPGYSGEYDEYPQGSEFDAWVVLKVTEADGTEMFFRKGGTANSYGTVAWDKPIQHVRVTEKIVQVFETVQNYEVV